MLHHLNGQHIHPHNWVTDASRCGYASTLQSDFHSICLLGFVALGFSDREESIKLLILSEICEAMSDFQVQLVMGHTSRHQIVSSVNELFNFNDYLPTYVIAYFRYFSGDAASCPTHVEANS